MAKKRTLSGGPAEHLAQRIGACKNPEFAQWLREWWEEASKRDANKIQFVYKKAMESMIAHPNPILEVQAAQRLPYIGPTIVSRLERKLAEWKTAGGQLKAISEAPQTTANMPPAPPIPTDALQQTTPSNDRRDAIRKRQKPYIPAFRSGPYAMLIALHLESQGLQSKGYCSRQDILTLGQPYCKVALEEGTYPALRGAIKILEEKGFMTKWGVPTRFCLTDDGADLAAKLWNSGERRSSAPLPSNAGSMATPSKENSRGVESPMDFVLEDAPPEPAISTFTWPPSSFDVFLLVDNREVKSKNDRDYIINRLQEDGIPSELRNLDLGDFLWVARKKVSHRHGGYDDLEEAVLDLVVERKTEDDLVQSIIDGRFLDQKFRLNSSGLDRKIYLVEKFEQVDFRSIGEDRFCAAIVHTQIIDDLNLRYTSGLEDSLRFLCDLHHNIVEQLQVSFSFI